MSEPDAERVLILVQDIDPGDGGPARSIASPHGRDLLAAMRQPWAAGCQYRRITEVPGISMDIPLTTDDIPQDAIWEQYGPGEPWVAVPAFPASP